MSRSIVQVIDSLARAGAERVVVDLSAGLAARGWDVLVVVSERDGALEGELDAAGVGIEHVEHSMLWGVDGIAKLRSFLSRHRPGVVHTHLLGSDIMGRTAALLSATPVIVSTMHEMRSRGWKYDSFRRMTSRRISATVACSEEVERFCKESLQVPESKLVRIDNGVDTRRFSPGAGPPVAKPDPSIVCVAGLKPGKGHETLLQAFAGLVGSIPDARLSFAGSGSLEEPLRLTATQLGLADNVRFLGDVADVAALLRDADLFVLDSDSEGLPVSVLEAMAAGVPVIVSRVGSIPEVVDRGSAGILVEPSDPQDLLQALLNATDPTNQAKLAERVQAARQRIVEHYSSDRMVDAYEQLYERLLSSASATATGGRS